MCSRCEELDAKISQFQKRTSPLPDPLTLGLMREAIAELEQEKQMLQCERNQGRDNLTPFTFAPNPFIRVGRGTAGTVMEPDELQQADRVPPVVCIRCGGQAFFHTPTSDPRSRRAIRFYRCATCDSQQWSPVNE